MGANPTDDRNRTRELYIFIHNVYANFFKDTLDYFSMHLWPRFEHRVVATYDKAVEYITKHQQYDREVDRPILPAIILNPSGDFEWADAISGGHQLWRFPNLAPGMIKRIYDPIYQDQNVLINVGFMRIQGDIEVLMLLNSFYEYCDVRMLLFQIFGGIDRWIYPQYFTSFIILPHNILNYTYSNPYTGQVYKLNWQQAGIYEKLVRSTAKNEMVLPLEIKPVYKMTGFNDASDRYGGTEKLADWRLGATIRYEIEIPTYFIVESDYLASNVSIDLRTGSTYSQYSFDDVPVDRFLLEASHDWGLDETSYSVVDLTSDSTSCETVDQGDYQFTTRYYHVISQAEANSTTAVSINIPETITDNKLLIVNSVLGTMDYGDHYIISNGGNTLQIKVDNVDLEPGQVIELYVYKRNPYA